MAPNRRGIARVTGEETMWTSATLSHLIGGKWTVEGEVNTIKEVFLMLAFVITSFIAIQQLLFRTRKLSLPMLQIPMQLQLTLDTEAMGTNAEIQGESSSEFSATLTGEAAFQPVTTNATGNAEFMVADDGNAVDYVIEAVNIDGGSDVYVAASSGGRFIDIVQGDRIQGCAGKDRINVIEGNDAIAGGSRNDALDILDTIICLF
jgi:hypothetical protein